MSEPVQPILPDHKIKDVIKPYDAVGIGKHL
jgi:hypothetical protein